MRNTKYDFTDAIKELSNYGSPQELSSMLKDAALSVVGAEEEDYLLTMMRKLCEAVSATCSVLDKIKVTEE